MRGVGFGSSLAAYAKQNVGEPVGSSRLCDKAGR
jgi:hypothetical protein